MRTSAALGKIQVNFSFALVGTNFATTEALALPRSAERKVRPRKGEGVGKDIKKSDSSGINATSSKPKEGVEEKRKLSLLDKRDEEQSDGGSWKRQ